MQGSITPGKNRGFHPFPDIGCRMRNREHAIELSKRGHVVTGIDLSASMLEHARQKAKFRDWILISGNMMPGNCPFRRSLTW
jgi:predicted TPR repeat methyltransferase